MTKIRCVVERITYQNPENGYSVLKVRVKGYEELVAVVGNLLDANVGSVLLIDGEWKVDSKYGRQFMALKWEETLPATVYGMEKYLGSGLIKGVGPKYAKKIVQKFGTDTFSVIEDNIHQLIEIPGIGQRRIQMIAESWEKQKEIKNVMIFLQDHGVSTAFAARIYKQYGNESIGRMKENPYQLADDIWGIGFKTADSIGEKLGFDRESYVRLRSGIMYALSRLADDGHVYAEKKQLKEQAAKLLDADENCIVMTLDQMLKDKDLIRECVNLQEKASGTIPDTVADANVNTDINVHKNEHGNSGENGWAEREPFRNGEDGIYLPPFYYAETGTSNKLKKLASEPASDRLWALLHRAGREKGNNTLNVDVDRIEQAVGMKYDPDQADAVRQAGLAKIMVLTGGPGTGKTTVTRGIIEAYKMYGLKILLAAPTGRAAKRMSEATGLEAKTIHRLLECKPPEGYQKNEENPLTGDVLIIDECSMIDILLMNALLKAIPVNMRLVLVGDIDQLPSVGAGNVLRDIIDSGRFPVIRLTRIFRQARESRIIMNAHRINQGKMPDISNGRGTDFFFVEKEEPELAAEEIINLVEKRLPGYYGLPSSSIQVLTPMQRGVIGATNLNLKLQEALNPSGDGLRRSGFVFRSGDRVMQIKNNYEKEIFNGDIGAVESVDISQRSLTVNYDGKRIEYDSMELDELAHAYAITIHKAQGSEYPVVVMPVMMSHYMMLQRNLIYTGITRAKKGLVILGTKKAIALAVENVTVVRRNTMLSRRLCDNI